MATKSLTEYSAKRSFSATTEPPLFIVQQHSATRLRYETFDLVRRVTL